MENIFSAVAVVYIEIGNRNPLQAMMLKSMGSSYGYVIEDAKSRCTGSFRMVSGWADIAKGVPYLTGHNKIDSFDPRTCCIQGGIQTVRVHSSITIQMYKPRMRGLAEHPFDILDCMDTGECFFVCLGHLMMTEKIPNTRSD